jgi:SCY1-like protein 2
LVCTSTTLLSVRVNSLICIGKLLEHMDKWQVIDDVLPWLPQIPSKEPAVIMAIVGIFKLAFSNSKLGLTKEVMANKVLPFLIPLSIENGLTVQQFNSITTIIREMFSRVESEHRTKLEQLNSIQDSQKSTLKVGLSDTLSPGQLVAAPTSQEVIPNEG